MMTPPWQPRWRTMIPTLGVGTSPTSTTSTPAAHKPAVTADISIWPLARIPAYADRKRPTSGIDAASQKAPKGAAVLRGHDRSEVLAYHAPHSADADDQVLRHITHSCPNETGGVVKHSLATPPDNWQTSAPEAAIQ